MDKYQLTQTGQQIQDLLNAIDSLAPTFSTTSTYAVNDIVKYSGAFYKCITVISTAGDWDSTKWEAMDLSKKENSGELSYSTTTPTAANTNGKLKTVVLSSEPATKYEGYLYIITGA